MKPTTELSGSPIDGQEPVPEVELDLRAAWSVLWKRRRLAALIFGVIFVIVAIVTFSSKPIYKATAQVLIERKTPNVLPFQDISGGDRADDWKAAETYYQTQMKLLESRALATRVLDRLKLRESEEMADVSRAISRGHLEGDTDVYYAEAFIGQVEVEQVKNSRLFAVSYLSRDPQRAADIANAIAEAYILLNNEVASNTSETATKSLQDQIKDLQDEVRRRETEVQVYARQHNLVYIDFNNRQDVALVALKELNDEYNAAKADRIAKEVHLEAMRQADISSLPDIVNSPLVASLKADYSRLSQERSQMATKFGPEWPQMIEVETRLKEAQARLDAATRDIATAVLKSAEVEYHTALEREMGLKRAIEKQTDDAQTSDMAAIVYRTMRADLDSRKANLDAMMKRAGEAGISAEVDPIAGSNVRIIDRATVPHGPYRPRRVLNLALGLLLGLLVGTGVAFGAEYLDNSVKTVEELVQLARVPVLAHIPLWEEAEDGVGAAPIAVRGPASAAAEAFRELRTSLLLSDPGHERRSLVITSPLPEEGKTSVALNLAAALAQAGKQVLLIDTDLRRPRLHRAVGVGNGLGLGNFLAGSHTLEQVIQEGPVPGLSVVTSGPLPPNPAELLGSATFRAFLADLEGRGFDHILFDSPPVLSAVDAIVLAAQTQSLLLVARAGVTPREAVREARNKLSQAKIRPIGSVLNGITADHARYYYYQYGYGRDAPEFGPTPPADPDAAGPEPLSGTVARLRGGRRRFIER